MWRGFLVVVLVKGSEGPGFFLPLSLSLNSNPGLRTRLAALPLGPFPEGQ